MLRKSISKTGPALLSILALSAIAYDGSALTLSGIDCSLKPDDFAIGFASPLRAIDVNGDDEPDAWEISNDFGNLISCNDVAGLPCEHLWHHTGVDYLLGSATSSQHSDNRPVYAVDNGIVVFSTNGNTNPRSKRGGLVIIKHMAPPGVKFYVPSYSEEFSGSGQPFKIMTNLRITEEIFSYYLHLAEPPLVAKGDTVSRGQNIGQTYGKDEGFAFAPHLHLEIWWKCQSSEPNGYETEGSQFQSTATNQLVNPDSFIYWNREAMNVIPDGTSESLVRVQGYDFGPVPGVLRLGSNLPMSLPAVDNEDIDWNDQALRFDLFAPWPSVPMAIEMGYLNRGVDVMVRKAGAEQRVRTASYPFRDVPATKWYAEHVVQLQRSGTISGFGQSSFFLPHEPIKRSEFLKLIVGSVCPTILSGSPCTPDAVALPFVDLNDHWALPFVREAWNLGWLSSFSLFRPDDPIMRSEAAKLTHDALEFAETTTADTPFSDVSAADWFAPYAVALHRAGIISGYTDGTFRPGGSLLRSEAAKIVKQAFHNWQFLQ